MPLMIYARAAFLNNDNNIGKDRNQYEILNCIYISNLKAHTIGIKRFVAIVVLAPGLNHVDSQPHLFAMLRLNCVALRALSHFPLVNNSLKV